MSLKLRVLTSSELIPDDRNFGARVEKDVLLLPEKFLSLLVAEKIDTSDLFYAFVITRPREVAAALGWTVDQVAKAKNGLREIIQRSVMPPPPSKSSRPSFAPPPQYRPPSSLPPRPKPSFAPPPSLPPKKRNG